MMDGNSDHVGQRFAKFWALFVYEDGLVCKFYLSLNCLKEELMSALPSLEE